MNVHRQKTLQSLFRVQKVKPTSQVGSVIIWTYVHRSPRPDRGRQN